MAVPVFTLQSAIDRVDYHLRDGDSATASFSPWEKEAVIESQLRLLAPRLLLADQWTTPLVTLAAGTDTYLLPSTTGQDYDRLKRLRLQSNGLEIPIVSLRSFESYREGEVPVLRGTPVVAMIVQGVAAAPSLRFWPTPEAVDYVDGFFSLLAAPFNHNEAANIPLDEMAFEALCYSVALELYGRMSEDELAKRNLGPGTPALWEKHIATGIMGSRHRRRRQQSSGVVLRSRRW